MFKFIYQNKQQTIINLEAALGIFLSALIFILPLLYIGSLRDPSSLPRYTLYGISSGIILLLVLFKNLAEHKSPAFQKNLFVTVILLLSWAWLSLSWSIDPKNSLLHNHWFFSFTNNKFQNITIYCYIFHCRGINSLRCRYCTIF